MTLGRLRVAMGLCGLVEENGLATLDAHISESRYGAPGFGFGCLGKKAYLRG
jgi:hypothetical protein